MITLRTLLVAPAVLAATLFLVTPAFAGPGQDFIQARRAELSAVLRQPASAARAKKTADLMETLIDFDSLARESLRKHWDDLNKAQQDEFTEILKALIKKNYEKNIQKTLDYEIKYVDESPAGDQVTVRTTAKATKSGDKETISIDYRLRKTDRDWLIIDIVTENSSLVATNRNQFNKVMKKDGFDALLKKLKTKVAEKT